MYRQVDHPPSQRSDIVQINTPLRLKRAATKVSPIRTDRRHIRKRRGSQASLAQTGEPRLASLYCQRLAPTPVHGGRYTGILTITYLERRFVAGTMCLCQRTHDT